jgi:hypothetical protein
MTDTFTFPNTPAGQDQRNAFVVSAAASGRTCREFEETWADGKQVTTVLRLEVSNRPDEGQIARAMKERKS